MISVGKLTGLGRIAGLVVASVFVLAACGGQAFAAAGPFWSLDQQVAPRYIPPGGEGEVIVTATNLGVSAAEGGVTPVTISDALPPGLTATGVEAAAYNSDRASCTLSPLSCTYAGSLLPYGHLEMVIQVVADANAVSGNNDMTVFGGGAASVSHDEQVTVSSAPVSYGVEKYRLEPFNEDGSLDTQAGSHPYQLTTAFDLNMKASAGNPSIISLAKDLRFILPPGLVGDPEIVPRCSEAAFTHPLIIKGVNRDFDQCSDDTFIGVASVIFASSSQKRLTTWDVPLTNLVPNVGEPARFGFNIFGIVVYLDTSVRTGGDYGVTVSVNNINQTLGFVGSQVTFWGVPGDPRHDSARGSNCLMNGQFGDGGTCGEPAQLQHVLTPFLTLPTSCDSPFQSSVLANTWEEPGNFRSGEYTLHDGANPSLSLDGCNRLSFDPSISVAPDGQAASTPTGLTVGLHVPQEATLTPSGLAESDVKDTTVTLPEGVALNPAAADGLLSCSLDQIALGTTGVPSCPEASKVGTVQIDTPLLPKPLEGSAYLAQQNANPFGSLVALYIVAEEPTSGVLVKLAGRVVPDPVTGQIVSTFENTPPLPFSDLHLHFFGTARAPLSTPASCGTYTTRASIAPWSGNTPAQPSSSFQITSGPNGSACSDPLPFSPSLTAGSTNIQAGAFSPFTMTMSRDDGNQNLSAVKLRLPLGLLGTLSSVKLCGETDANAGTCGPESLIGHTVVSVGLGGDPFTVTGGQVFITGPYQGAPYGLSIVNPAKAGPFDLGQVVVRAKIEVDPATAALTVTTDSTGPYAIPQMLDGIPLQIKHVNVTIDRSGFTFNPTNCDPMTIGGSLQSSHGSSSVLHVPFQVTNCATLAFKPRFTVSTAGKTSRVKGASLDVKLAYPKAAWGSQANIKSVKVDLPKQLPSRLTTLQKACPDRVFDQNPASCPPASRVGVATASTPIIPVGLSGPAYFVSHGGAKFPELIIVLSGYGVSVQLHGETFISKAGITSSTFRSVPDVPIGSFELTLPQGEGSALAANGNLCKSTLKMPTTFTAQNGLVIHQSTPVTTTGCAKHKAKKARKANRGGKRRHKKGAHGKR
jgi:hypothetical protein